MQCLLVAALALIVGDLDRAILLSALMAATIIGASMRQVPSQRAEAHRHGSAAAVRRHCSILHRSVSARGGSCPGRKRRRRPCGARDMLSTPPDRRCRLDLRILLLAVALVACALTHRISGGAAAFRKIAAEPRCFFSTFMASLVDTLSWRQVGGFALSDIADEPLPLLPATPAPDHPLPRHHHHPARVGLRSARCLGFQSNRFAMHSCHRRMVSTGSLHVDIFGGGSWQSEFSVLTGLSSASFGPNAYFLFKTRRRPIPSQPSAVRWLRSATRHC